MKYTPRHVVFVFTAVQELGLANTEEILDFLSEEMNTKIDLDDVKLILERLRAKDILSINADLRYKLSKIPAPFLSCKKANVVKMRAKDCEKIVKEVEAILPQGAPLVGKKGYITGYVMVDITFQNVDPILGGVPNGENRLALHRNYEGIPIITGGQLRGWFRQNERAIGLDSNAHNWIGFAEAVPTTEPKLTTVKAPIVVQRKGVGIAEYEAFAPGNTFKTFWRIPLEGVGFTKENYENEVKEYFKAVEICPVRGLGANPHYHGGKVKLVKLEPA